MHASPTNRMIFTARQGLVPAAVFLAGLLAFLSCGPAGSGLFEYRGDIGRVTFPGSVTYNAGEKTYAITASGENMWGTSDAFYFVWNEVTGDMSLSADIRFIGEGLHPHRKGGVMIRGGLEPDDPYVDAVVHGDGLISLQYREVKGGETRQITAPDSGQAAVMLENRGDRFTMIWMTPGEPPRIAGSVTVSLPRRKYAGLVMCSHDSTVTETAVFSGVNFKASGAAE